MFYYRSKIRNARKKVGERKKERKKRKAGEVVDNDEGEGNPSRVAERESGWESREEEDGGRVLRAGSKNNGGRKSNRRRAEVKG